MCSVLRAVPAPVPITANYYNYLPLIAPITLITANHANCSNCHNYPIQSLQVGVKVPNAAELGARKVKAWRQEAREDEDIVQIDLRNSFNSVDRNVLLREVRERAPTLHPMGRVTSFVVFL